MIVRFWRILIALVAGTLIYLGIERFLPAAVQHRGFEIDWGLALAVVICLFSYGVVRFIR